MTVRIAIKDCGETYLVKILPDKDYVIGRSSSATIKISDEAASGKHCKIFLKKDIICIQDLNSKNGTKLNNLKVSDSATRIYIGDKITVGNTILTLDTKVMTISEKKKFTKTNRINDDLTLKNTDKSMKIVGFGED